MIIDTMDKDLMEYTQKAIGQRVILDQIVDQYYRAKPVYTKEMVDAFIDYFGVELHERPKGSPDRNDKIGILGIYYATFSEPVRVENDLFGTGVEKWFHDNAFLVFDRILGRKRARECPYLKVLK